MLSIFLACLIVALLCLVGYQWKENNHKWDDGFNEGYKCGMESMLGHSAPSEEHIQRLAEAQAEAEANELERIERDGW